MPGIRSSWAAKPRPICPAPTRPTRSGPARLVEPLLQACRDSSCVLSLVWSVGARVIRKVSPTLQQGQVAGPDADVAGELGARCVPSALRSRWPRLIRLSRTTSPTASTSSEVVAEWMVSPGLRARPRRRSPVQDGDVVQLGWGVVAEEDEQAVAEELLDLAAHLRDRRLVEYRESVPVMLLHVLGLDAGDEQVLGDELGQRPGRTGRVDVHRLDLLHRVDPDPRGATTVDDRHGDLVELRRAGEPVEGLPAGQLRDPCATGWIPPPVIE